MTVYIGYDSREDIAYQVCKASIQQHSNTSIKPLIQSELREAGIYTREADKASTEFSLTRFLVPYLNECKGWAIFCDCDFLFTRNIEDVTKHLDPHYAAYVVKHSHYPVEQVKMDGQTQSHYPKKNWSSFIVWNCEHELNKELTPKFVNAASPSFLHQFKWLEHNLIGELDYRWNFLVGYYKAIEGVLPWGIHYTNGIPAMAGYENCDYSAEWRDMEKHLNEIRDSNEF